MATRFMTDPHAMRAMAGRFEVHAQTVEDEARRMWASSQNISGAGWSGLAEATSLAGQYAGGAGLLRAP
ncbi:EsxJ [Mycobacterium kansasii]|nr:EsxJ [Mycobacterium kansasii]